MESMFPSRGAFRSLLTTLDTRDSLKSRIAPEGLGFIGSLPGELWLVSPEVTVSRGLFENRPSQTEAIDDPSRRERKMSANEF